MAQGLKNYNWARLRLALVHFTLFLPLPSLYGPCDHRMLRQSHTQMSFYIAHTSRGARKNQEIEKKQKEMKNVFYNYYYN